MYFNNTRFVTAAADDDFIIIPPGRRKAADVSSMLFLLTCKEHGNSSHRELEIRAARHLS